MLNWNTKIFRYKTIGNDGYNLRMKSVSLRFIILYNQLKYEKYLGDDYETISCGFGSDSHSGEFLFKEIFDECGLTG